MCHSLGRLPILCVTLLRTTEGCEFGDFFWPPVIFLRKLLMDLIWVSVLPASWAIRKKSSMMSWERNPGIFLFLFIFIFPCFFGLLLVIKSAYIQQVNKICPLFYSYFPSFFPFPSFFSFFPPLLPQNSSLCSNFCQKITGIYIPVQYKGEKAKYNIFPKVSMPGAAAAQSIWGFHWRGSGLRPGQTVPASASRFSVLPSAFLKKVSFEIKCIL